MKLVRSWPRDEPGEFHAHIVDNSDKVYIPAVDYRPLRDVDDDVIHMDWDVAVGRNELRAFAQKCVAEPDIVRVAPTMVNPTRVQRGNPGAKFKDTWLVFKQMPLGRESLEPGEPYCDYYGFGMVYLPRWTIVGFTDYLKARGDYESFLDSTFDVWYRKVSGKRVPVEWDTNAVHINYSMKDALEGIA